MDTLRTPRRFRRRLLAVMTALGLLPLLAWGVISEMLMERAFSLRTAARLEDLLSQADEQLAPMPAAAPVREQIAATRLNLAQAELARRSLSRLMPRMLVLTMLVSAIAVAGVALLFGRQLARPQEQLAAGMARYASGDLAHRIPDPGGSDPDEMLFLVRQFNRMGDELAAQRARLEVTEALAAWQGVARALAHELKNPLTAMRMAVGRLARIGPDRAAEDAADRRGESLQLIEAQIDALRRLADSFATFARLPAPRLARLELQPLAAEVCALYAHASPVAIENAVPSGIDLDADRDLLAQALSNLVKNAVEASPAGAGAVRVSAVVEDGWVRLEVTDRGRGVDAVLEGAALARSLGTTKADGSGLGLPIAHKIVHEHGGSLRLMPRAEGGTAAVARLPLAPKD